MLKDRDFLLDLSRQCGYQVFNIVDSTKRDRILKTLRMEGGEFSSE